MNATVELLTCVLFVLWLDARCNCKLKAQFYKKHWRVPGAPDPGGLMNGSCIIILVSANSGTYVSGTDYMCVKQEDGVAAF